jgi:hypothetical protein
MSAATSARQAGREAAARAVERGVLPLRKGVTTSARAVLMSPPREGLADISNGCVSNSRGARRGMARRGAAPRGGASGHLSV